MIKILLSRKLGELRWTQAELARATGIRPTTINEMYHEISERVNLEHLDLICEALDCDLDELIIRIPNTYPKIEHNRAGSKVHNGLYDALVRMGKETCDCYVLSGLSAAQKKKLMLADNRVYELGITDSDVFDAILKDLGGDFDIPGWDPDLIEMITASMADTDDMVKGYGVYEGEEVDRISSKTVEDHSPAQGAAPSYAPSTQQEERPSDSHA